MTLLYIVAEKVKQFLRKLSNGEHIWQKGTYMHLLTSPSIAIYKYNYYNHGITYYNNNIHSLLQTGNISK